MRKQQTDEQAGAWVFLLAVFLTFAAFLAFMSWASGAFADGLPRRGAIAAPPSQQLAPTYVPAPADAGYKVHNWYVGGVAGYNFGIVERDGDKPFVSGDETWQGGIVAGYLWRSAVLGVGVEADYVIRDLGDFALDDGTASVRGRLGLFVAPGTFVYGSAGVAQATPASLSGDLRKGLVVGGGVEKDISANLALRAEVLHYRHAESHFEWGEEGSTAVRGGVLFKF